MIVYDASSAENEAVFNKPPSKTRVTYIQEAGEEKFNALTTQDVVILVHGFNSSRARVEQVYKQVAALMYESGRFAKNTAVVGFRWPSNGNVFSYGADLKDAHIAATALLDVVAKLRSTHGVVQRVHLVAHSMGGEVCMRALELATRYEISTITLLGADVCSRDMATDKRYGQLSHKLTRLVAYYSAGDGIVNTIARFWPGRWFARVGAVGLPATHPANYIAYDAQMLTGIEVDHNTYSVNPMILGSVAAGIADSRGMRGV